MVNWNSIYLVKYDYLEQWITIRSAHNIERMYTITHTYMMSMFCLVFEKHDVCMVRSFGQRERKAKIDWEQQHQQKSNWRKKTGYHLKNQYGNCAHYSDLCEPMAVVELCVCVIGYWRYTMRISEHENIIHLCFKQEKKKRLSKIWHAASLKQREKSTKYIVRKLPLTWSKDEIRKRKRKSMIMKHIENYELCWCMVWLCGSPIFSRSQRWYWSNK